jgi:hypothetical protein
VVLRAALEHYSTADLAALPAALVNIELEIPDWKGIHAALLKNRNTPHIPRRRGDAVHL